MASKACCAGQLVRAAVARSGEKYFVRQQYGAGLVDLAQTVARRVAKDAGVELTGLPGGQQSDRRRRHRFRLRADRARLSSGFYGTCIAGTAAGCGQRRWTFRRQAGAGMRFPGSAAATGRAAAGPVAAGAAAVRILAAEAVRVAAAAEPAGRIGSAKEPIRERSGTVSCLRPFSARL